MNRAALRAIQLLALPLAAAPASKGAAAQVAAPTVPARYSLPTYEEDWQRLAEPDQSGR
jgi:hypothetical protein